MNCLTVPYFEPSSCMNALDTHAELGLSGSLHDRRCCAIVARHFLNLEFMSRESLKLSMESRTPFSRLREWENQGIHNLLTHVEAHAAQVSNFTDASDPPCISLNLIRRSPTGYDDVGPLLGLQIEEPWIIELHSLRTMGIELSRMVCRAICLIERCFARCMTPDDAWTWHRSFQDDCIRDEYETLRRVGGWRDLDSTLKEVEAMHSHSCSGYFSDEKTMLRRQLIEQHISEYCKPGWIVSLKAGATLAQTRRLASAAQSFLTRNGSHPWLSYVTDVCRAVTENYTSDDDIEREWRTRESTVLDHTDGYAPLFTGIIVYTGTSTERISIENLVDDQRNCGEWPAEFIELDGTQSHDWLLHLKQIAVGAAFLRRAQAIDRSQNHPRNNRYHDNI